MRKIRIDWVSDRNKKINRFFRNCIPYKLDLLSINFNWINTTGIKLDFYLDSISFANKSVVKEIYLDCFIINETGLERIIKSAF